MLLIAILIVTPSSIVELTLLISPFLLFCVMILILFLIVLSTVVVLVRSFDTSRESSIVLSAFSRDC